MAHHPIYVLALHVEESLCSSDIWEHFGQEVPRKALRFTTHGIDGQHKRKEREESVVGEMDHLSTTVKDTSIIHSSGRGMGGGRGGDITYERKVRIHPMRSVENVAWLLSGDVAAEPLVELGHSGIDSREFGEATTVAKTHNSNLDPDATLFDHHWSTWISLHKEVDDNVNFGSSFKE